MRGKSKLAVQDIPTLIQEYKKNPAMYSELGEIFKRT